MKRLLQKAGIALTILMASVTATHADTTVISDGADGWQKLTALPTNLTDYYFVFVDDSQDLMLELRKGTNNPNNALYYMTSQNPLLNRTFLWTLEANNGSAGQYSMRNVEFPSLMMQTEYNKGYLWNTHDQKNPCEWTAVNMQYDSSNRYWTFENGKYPSSSSASYKGFLGPWKEDNTNTSLVSGQELAANKSGNYIGHFQIYAISKDDASTYYSTLMDGASTESPVDVSYLINNREANLDGMYGWTTSGLVVRNNGSATYDGIAGFFEPSDWGASSFTCTMKQTISNLPGGLYQVATVAQASTGCQLTLSVTSGSNTISNDLASKGDAGSSISPRGGWEWLTSDNIIVSTGSSLDITITTTASAQHNWGNADGFRLYYLGPLSNKEDLLSQLEDLITNCAPYDDVTDESDYTTKFNIYKNYNSSNTVEELKEAINYITTNFPIYQWTYASIIHPMDITEGIISGADCTSNDAWPGSGRTTKTGTYYDGSQRTYFTQNHESGPARSQDVTIPKAGAYLLRTIVRPQTEEAYATISVDDLSTTTRGRQTGSNNIGNGWACNDVYFGTIAPNTVKTIRINLSNENNNREADCGEMHLYYIGQSTDFVKNGTHYYVGVFENAPAIELTDETPIANATAAIFTSGTPAVTFTNPNGLVFTNSSANGRNIVVDGTCSNLQLESGHAFVNPIEFTATSANYTVTTANMASGQFATLMLPFNASSLPGTAYQLDQGADLISGTLRGTAVTNIEANKPVLVTKAGNYTGSNVRIPVVSSGTTYLNGELVGVYEATTAPEGSYVLQNHTNGEGVAFYLVGSTKPTVGPFRAYIRQQEAGARAALFFSPEDVTGISSTMSDEHPIYSGGNAYDLQGRRIQGQKNGTLQGLKRGFYIVNGKKMVVK